MHHRASACDEMYTMVQNGAVDVMHAVQYGELLLGGNMVGFHTGDWVLS